MDFEENLINQYNQLKSREEVKSGYHKFAGVTIKVIYSIIGKYLYA
jgi:hypothetical protein